MELPKEIQIGGQVLTTQICEELKHEREYIAKLRDKMMKAKDFPMTD